MTTSDAQYILKNTQAKLGAVTGYLCESMPLVEPALQHAACPDEPNIDIQPWLETEVTAIQRQVDDFFTRVQSQ